MLLKTDHRVLSLDSDSLSKVQNISYKLWEQAENVIGVYG
jgi:hypothetical protein